VTHTPPGGQTVPQPPPDHGRAGALVWLHYLSLLASPITPIGAATGDAMTYVLGFGPLGLGVILYQLGLIIPKKTYAEKAADARSWRDLYESERAAHTATREAFATQAERLQVAVESGRVTEALLREVRARAISPKD
jgi:hypothetical protein